MSTAAAAHITNPVIKVSDINTVVNCEPRVHDLRLAEVLGFGKRHDIRSLIRRHMDTLKGFGEVSFTREKPSGRGGRPGTDYWLNKRQALYITAKSDTERAALVTVQMVEVFDAVTSGGTVAVKPHRRRAPAPRRGPIPRVVLETYATWLWAERVAVLEELYPNVPPGHRTGVAVGNPGAFYHRPSADVILPAPSTRADSVLRLVGCPLPKPAARPKRVAG